MSWFCNIPYLSIFVIIIGAMLLSVLNKPRLSYQISLWTALLVFVASLILLICLVYTDTAYQFTMGKFPAPFGNEIKFGPLQALFSLVFSLVMALALLGGKKDLFEDVPESKIGLACVMFNMTLAALLALAYTNDIFTAYVFIEISTISSCALVVIKENKRTLAATIRYLFMSLLGSGLFLFGIIVLYGITGHLLMPQLTVGLLKLYAAGEYAIPLMISATLITAGLGIKSAMFPFHRWLPGAHGNATTAASSVLSGLVLKGYALLLICFFARVFTLDVIRALGIHNVVLFLGFLGMIAGSVMALKENHIKRMLAYSSVAQLGYVFMGIGLGTWAGLAAACLQIITHACTKPLLFSCAGRLSSVCGHKKNLDELEGSARAVPLAGIGFTVGALSMIGIPLLAGFTAKVEFATASFDDTARMLIVICVLALSSILNALYYIPALLSIWSAKGIETDPAIRHDTAFAVASVSFMICILILGVFSQPVLHVIDVGLRLM